MQLSNKVFFAQIEQMLAEGNDVQFLVKGYSMRPLLRSERDTVILTPYRNQSLHCGDVVLFRWHRRHILHRIVQIEGQRLTLEGDGNYRKQEHCMPHDVLGIVRQVVRHSGRVVACDSRSWRFCSRTWKLIPPFIRKCALALLFRLGCK